MDFPHPPTTASVAGHPIHTMFAQFPTVCFVLTLFTDLAYYATANILWQNFSSWLLFAGLVFGAVALLAGLVDLVGSSSLRRQGPTWPYAIGFVVSLVLALINSFVHAGDGWTAVVPLGIALSAVTVVVIAVTSWLGRSLVFKYGVGVSNYE